MKALETKIVRFFKFVTLISYLDKLENQKKDLRQKKEEMIARFPEPKDHHASFEQRVEYMQELALENNKFMIKATQFREKEKDVIKLQVKIRLYRRAVVLLLVLVVSIVAQLLFPLLGKNIKIEYFTVLTQLYPVLLIACYLNNNTTKDTEYNKLRYFVEAKFTGFFLTCIGLIVCLLVLARGTSNTASLILSIVTIVFMLRVLLQEIIERR